MKNRIEQIIKDKGYNSIYDFAIQNDLSHQRVRYWAKAEKQTKALTESIKLYLGVDKYIY